MRRNSKTMRRVCRRSLIILRAELQNRLSKTKEESRKKTHAQKIKHELQSQIGKKSEGNLGHLASSKPPNSPHHRSRRSHPGRYQNPKKPVKSAYPEKPKQSPRPPVNRPKVRQMRMNQLCGIGSRRRRFHCHTI